MQKETNVDCMKYRKSTHLAGVDVESIVDEKGSCILTISEAYYAKGVDVSGNKTDGYFLEFKEPVKGMVVNSGNRVKIAKMVKEATGCTSTESRNISNWVGFEIELFFDATVKMMGKITGGIKVKHRLPKPTVTDEKALSLLDKCESLEDLKTTWSNLTKEEQKLITVLSKKDELKNTLK